MSIVEEVQDNRYLEIQMIVRPRRFSSSQMGLVPLDSGQTHKRSVSANNSARMQNFSKDSYNTSIMFVKPLEASRRRLSQSLDSGLISLPSSHQDESRVCSSASTPTTSEAVQVHEFLFLGNTETSMNTRYILQNNIQYFVNVFVKKTSTNVIHSSELSPTNIQRTTNALQSTMTVSYRENMPLEDLFELFQAVNDMIKKARNKAKRVLIYSDDNSTICQAFAIAYDVQYYEMNLHRVMDNFQRLKIDVKLNCYLRMALRKWVQLCERKRKDSEITAMRQTNCQEKMPATVDSTVKRIAWQ